MKPRRKNPERPGDYGLRLQAEKMHRQAVATVKRGEWYYGVPGERGVTFAIREFPDYRLTICDRPKVTWAGMLRTTRETLKTPLEYEILLNAGVSRFRPELFPRTGKSLHEVYAHFTKSHLNEAPDFSDLAFIVEHMRTVFVHEAIHMLDSRRTDHAALGQKVLDAKDKVRSARAYYNSPAELNAHYQAHAAESVQAWRKEIRDFIRGSSGMRRMSSLRRLAQRFQQAFHKTADAFARDFLLRLREHFGDAGFYAVTWNNRARLRKRAAGLWETLRAMTRAEIERRRRETAP